MLTINPSISSINQMTNHHYKNMTFLYNFIRIPHYYFYKILFNDKILIPVFIYIGNKQWGRKIQGRVVENGVWREQGGMRSMELYGEPDMVGLIKKIWWMGDVERVLEHRIPKRMFYAKPDGKRSRRRPRSRWLYVVEEDLQLLGVQDLEENSARSYRLGGCGGWDPGSCGA